MEKLWNLFKIWVAIQPEDVIEKASAFLCICPDGAGWVGDGAGAEPIEFDSIEEGWQRSSRSSAPGWNMWIVVITPRRFQRKCGLPSFSGAMTRMRILQGRNDRDGDKFTPHYWLPAAVMKRATMNEKKHLGFLATCDCPDYQYRSGQGTEHCHLSPRWQKAQTLVIEMAREVLPGVWEYGLHSPGSPHSRLVQVSQGDDGERAGWYCKHVLRVLAEELRRRYGHIVVTFLPPDVQAFPFPGEVVSVDGWLRAVVASKGGENG